MNIKVIAFDADDTLWINEPYFQETEHKFSELMEEYLPRHTALRELLQVEVQNLPLYGYGIKGFILSMIETAMKISENTISLVAVERIIGFGKALLARPIELLDGVEDVLIALKQDYRLVVATKGDLLDQERKLANSGIEHHFHHIEIMSDKKEKDYRKLIKHLDVRPEEFMMVGNSLKSDVMPVIAMGGYGYHIPYHTTWAHEHVEHAIEHDNFRQLTNIRELIPLLSK
ncbi:HAD family hydrolase [Segetibacter sp. 3557_3]|uniref:HAD family hydrolase n=1 Tax=Segetibacter sp. 3557_3 TaxID=2547429 RepID=UPI0010586F31|nr:HAD family hydrolase [Segetibacter sp. 3557_3]TDH27036.1 HAD family hydrolase [Segetibacter sp. 3557_3]